MTTPQISMVAYESRYRRVFVKIPDERARYFLCDPCVVQVACSLCGSAAGEPCKGHGKRYMTDTHLVRRASARRLRDNGLSPAASDQTTKIRVKLIIENAK